MVITLSFLGLDGQTSSSLEDDGTGHGNLPKSPLRKVPVSENLGLVLVSSPPQNLGLVTAFENLGLVPGACA